MPDYLRREGEFGGWGGGGVSEARAGPASGSS